MRFILDSLTSTVLIALVASGGFLLALTAFPDPTTLPFAEIAPWTVTLAERVQTGLGLGPETRPYNEWYGLMLMLLPGICLGHFTAHAWDRMSSVEKRMSGAGANMLTTSSAVGLILGGLGMLVAGGYLYGEFREALGAAEEADRLAIANDKLMQIGLLSAFGPYLLGLGIGNARVRRYNAHAAGETLEAVEAAVAQARAAETPKGMEHYGGGLPEMKLSFASGDAFGSAERRRQVIHQLESAMPDPDAKRRRRARA